MVLLVAAILLKVKGGNMCQQVLLKNDILRSASNIGLQSSRVVEQADDHTVVFTGRWVPGGWGATLLAPRDVVVKRTWRSAPLWPCNLCCMQG